MPDEQYNPILSGLGFQDPSLEPFAGLTASPKSGATLNPPSMPNEALASGGRSAMNALGDLLGITDAGKALRGEMTESEAQNFALNSAMSALLPGGAKLAGLGLVPMVKGVVKDVSGAIYAMGSKLEKGSGLLYNSAKKDFLSLPIEKQAELIYAPINKTDLPSAYKYQSELKNLVTLEKIDDPDYAKKWSAANAQYESGLSNLAKGKSVGEVSSALDMPAFEHHDNPFAKMDSDLQAIHGAMNEEPLDLTPYAIPAVAKPPPDSGWRLPSAPPTLEEQQARAMAGGFTTPAFRGVNKEPRMAPDGSGLEYYSSANPALAEMYATGYHNDRKNPMPQIQPLLLDTSNYHVVDAQGKGWGDVNNYAIGAARKSGKPGVVIHNVYDEPGSTKELGAPNTVYISLDPKTIKGKYAAFDPAQWKSGNLQTSIAGALAGTGGTAAIVSGDGSQRHYGSDGKWHETTVLPEGFEPKLTGE